MRIKPISPETLTASQRSLYDEMQQGVAAKYNDFQTMRDDGVFSAHGTRGYISQSSEQLPGVSPKR